jgi:hypothetical protein
MGAHGQQSPGLVSDRMGCAISPSMADCPWYAGLMTTLKHCYPTRCTTLKLPPGLGDYLRGGIALAHHALERGWGFELDFSGHPIGKFLDPTASAEASQAPIDEFFDERASLVYGWMDRLQEGQVGRTCTNLLPHESGNHKNTRQ